MSNTSRALDALVGRQITCLTLSTGFNSGITELILPCISALSSKFRTFAVPKSYAPKTLSEKFIKNCNHLISFNHGLLEFIIEKSYMASCERLSMFGVGSSENIC